MREKAARPVVLFELSSSTMEIVRSIHIMQIARFTVEGTPLMFGRGAPLPDHPSAALSAGSR
jgi:hypothetical protein